MKLSIILPTIRVEKIEKLYESISNSFSGDFELIIISPYEIPKAILDKPNVKYIQSWASPVVCQQIGLVHSTGEFIHRAVDDSLYIKGELDSAFIKASENTPVNIKFFEGEMVTHRNMADSEMYFIRYHLQAIKLYTPFDTQIMNFYIYPKKLLTDLGGWDCQFETIAFAELDLSLRMHLKEVKPVLTDNICIKCEWMPGIEGDHAPLHFAFDDDSKIYERIYNTPDCELRVVDLDNYKNEPERWERRFGK